MNGNVWQRLYEMHVDAVLAIFSKRSCPQQEESERIREEDAAEEAQLGCHFFTFLLRH
jgi:hypothetical protein